MLHTMKMIQLNISFGYERLGYSFLGDTTTSERRNFRMADSLVRKSMAVSTKTKRYIFNCYLFDTPWMELLS